jgi:hypothetical protein
MGTVACARTRLLLHACCGPCSLEPLRVLRAQGFDVTLCYSNSNIEPAAEYGRRLDTLRGWAAQEGVPVIEGACDRAAWERDVARFGTNRRARCAACYGLRLDDAARMAAQGGFDALSTTLAVSPYQLFDACGAQLARAAARAGVAAVWQDFRPLYPRATQRARELGLYRQNYCGCRFSAAEAALERAQAREARRAARDCARAQKAAAP